MIAAVTNHCFLGIIEERIEANTHHHLVDGSIVNACPATVNATLKLCWKLLHHIFFKVS